MRLSQPLGDAARRARRPRALRVAGRELEGRQVALEGALRLLELRLVEAGDLAQELELRLGVLIVEELDLDGAREPLGVVRLLVDRDERLGRGEVLRVEC